MSRSQHKSTEIISLRQLRKMTMILADRWSNICGMIESRNLERHDFQQRLDFWLK
ncbi:MAG: hypothetical protein AAFO95_13725 [Cyanobacteria bacterium J06600_6]